LAHALAHNLWKQTPDWIREDESWKALFRNNGNSDNGKDGATNGEYGQRREEKEGKDPEDGEFRDEMASLTAVIQKLQGLVVSGYDKLGSPRRMGRRRRVVRRAILRFNRSCGARKHEERSDNAEDAETTETTSKISTLEWHAALLAYWQLCNQIRERYPMWRDRIYRRELQFENTNQQLGSSRNKLEVGQDDSDYCTKRSFDEATMSKDECDEDIENMSQHLNNSLNLEMDQDTTAFTNCSDKELTIMSNDENEVTNKDGDSHWRLEPEQINEGSSSLNNLEPGQDDNADGTTTNVNTTTSNNENDYAGKDEETHLRPDQGKRKDNPQSAVESKTVMESPNAFTSNTENPIITLSEIKELQTMLEYAVWAYEPNEELLRSLLLSGNQDTISKDAKEDKQSPGQGSTMAGESIPGGYQLIVHRTTSYIEPSDNGNGVNINKADAQQPKQQNQKEKKQPSKKKNKRKPPGRVGYFVAVSHSQQTLLIGIKGTSTLEELLTDCCGRAVRVDLEHDPHGYCQSHPEDTEDATDSIEAAVDDVEKDVLDEDEDGVGTVGTVSELDRLSEASINRDAVLEEQSVENACDDIILNSSTTPSAGICKADKDEITECTDGVVKNEDDDVVEIVTDSNADRPNATDSDENEVIEEHHDKDDCEDDILSSSAASPANIRKSKTDKEEMIDRIHISTSDIVSPSESVEVELVTDSPPNCLSSETTETCTSRKTTSPSKSRQDQQQQKPSAKTMTSSLTASIPSSENVLLLPSSLSGSKQSPAKSQQDAPTSPPELLPSLTDEFMEAHGIEMESNRSHKLRGAHEGILHCAQQLLFELSPLIEEYAIAKEYEVVCTGHSLGAGVAVLLAVLMRGRYPMLTMPGTSSYIPAQEDEAFTNNRERQRQRVRAYAFAPPPVLDRSSALSCRHYVTSVVNNSDIIPRSSLTNLDAFLTVLEAVRCRLVEVGMNPSGGGGGGGGGSSNSSNPKKGMSAISSTMALFRKLSEGINGDLLLDPMELRKVLEEAIAEASLGDGEHDGFYWDEEFGHHLFVPGKLLMIHESWAIAKTVTSSANDDADSGMLNNVIGEDGYAVVPLQSPPCVRSRDSQGNGSKFESSDQHSPLEMFHAMWTDGTDAALKEFDIGAGSGMAIDHLTTSYERGLALLENKYAHSNNDEVR